MAKRAASLLILSFFIVAASVAGAAAETSARRVYPEVHRQESFLMQALLQTAAADFLGDGRTGLALVGRNYEQREAYVYVLYWDGTAFRSLWRSPNVWEEASHVAMAAGDFRGTGRTELAVLTVEKTRLFQWNGDEMALAYEGPGMDPSAEIGVVGHPDHPYDLIALTRRHAVNGLTPLLGVELWGWLGGGMRPLWETPTIGRVRAVAAGAGAGGHGDLVLEVGEGMGPGDIQVWSWDPDAYAYELTFAKPLRSQPAFGLATAVLDGADVVLAADDRGYLSVHKLGGAMPELGQSVSLGWALASVAAGDFFGNGGVQAVIAGYPNRLHVVELKEP